jgi:tRNA(Arg) A34 adenosine deaminase TadA
MDESIGRQRGVTLSYQSSSALTLRLPDWVDAYVQYRPGSYSTAEQRMSLAVGLGEMNSQRGTGGPFGAALFEEGGGLVAVGVNLVVPSSCSFAHAEMLAIGIAQQRLRSYDLGGPKLPLHELVTSTEPCGMCLGAISWSGVRRVVCGARESDARAIGFDEGPKPADWVAALATRGIEVLRDVCRSEAREVLRRYAEAGGPIYNARRG